jgi:hypothetical protein
MDLSKPKANAAGNASTDEKHRQDRERQDRLLDEALEESFPASDAPSAARVD